MASNNALNLNPSFSADTGRKLEQRVSQPHNRGVYQTGANPMFLRRSFESRRRCWAFALGQDRP